MKRYRDIAGDGGSDVVGQVEAQQVRLHARMAAMHGAQQRDLVRHDRSLHHAKEHRALLEASTKSGLASPSCSNEMRPDRR